MEGCDTSCVCEFLGAMVGGLFDLDGGEFVDMYGLMGGQVRRR